MWPLRSAFHEKASRSATHCSDAFRRWPSGTNCKWKKCECSRTANIWYEQCGDWTVVSNWAYFNFQIFSRPTRRPKLKKVGYKEGKMLHVELFVSTFWVRVNFRMHETVQVVERMNEMETVNVVSVRIPLAYNSGGGKEGQCFISSVWRRRGVLRRNNRRSWESFFQGRTFLLLRMMFQKCKECPKTFTRQDSLRRHTRKTHDTCHDEHYVSVKDEKHFLQIMFLLTPMFDGLPAGMRLLFEDVREKE